MDVTAIARVLVVAPLIAFVPGYAWLVALSPQVRGIARFVVAIVLSIALLTLALFGLSVLVHARVSGSNAVLDALCLTLAALAVRMRSWVPKRLAILE